MEITGKIIKVGHVETFPSGFIKREFIIETTEQYPQQLKVELLKDKSSLVDDRMLGETVTVHINLRGSEYNGKHYVSIVGWKITGAQSSGGGQDYHARPTPAGQSFSPPVDDDLPF